MSRKGSNSSKEYTEGGKKRLLREALSIKEKGNEFYRKGKYEEAVECYGKAIGKCPADKRIELAIFYQNRAASYQMLQKWQQAKDDCTRALDNNPMYIKAYVRRSKANQQLGHLYESLDDVTTTLVLESQEKKKTVEDLKTILKCLSVKEAFGYLNNKDRELPSAYFCKTYLNAYTKNLLKAVDVAHVDGSKGLARAKIALDAGKYEEIVPACTEEIVSTEPKFKDEALLLRGAMYVLMLRFEEAEGDFSSVLNKAEADPKIRASALMQRAKVNFDMGETELGFANFNEAEKLDPNNPDIFYNRAIFRLACDQFDESLEDCEKVLKLSPDHIEAYIRKCFSEFILTQNHWKAMSAIIGLKNAVEKYPNCEECHIILAQALCRQGQFHDADKFFKKAIRVYPQNARLLLNRGIMYLGVIGDINKASDILNKCIEVVSKCGLAYEKIGKIALGRGDLQKAVEAFEKAIKYAMDLTELTRCCALKCMTVAKLNVAKMLGIDVSTIVAVQRVDIHMFVHCNSCSKQLF